MQLATVQSPYLPYQAGGAFGAALVSEQAQAGRDLNGDGDAQDQVLHVFDGASGAVSNLGLAVYVYSWHRGMTGDLFLFTVHERAQGAIDVNEDGDVEDEILSVYSHATGAVTSYGFDVKVLLVGYPYSLLVVPERPGKDLNRDGDFGDTVVHLFDARDGTLHNIGLAAYAATSLWQAGDAVAFGVSESLQGGHDLNGDGDAFDDVLFVGGPKGIRSTRLATHRAWAHGSWAAAAVFESKSGFRDLNGDGDTRDLVLHRIDLESGEVVNERLALAIRSSAVVPPALSEQRLVFFAGEWEQGASDLDGDRDAYDVVAHVVDLESGLMTNTRLAVPSGAVAVDRTLIALLVSEEELGGRDLNGDGDHDDDVLHLLGEKPGARARNVGLAGSSGYFAPLRVSETMVTMAVPEERQRIDLNGDGDQRDFVFHALTPDGNLHNSGVTVSSAALRDGLVALAVEEQDQGFQDLDGDGSHSGTVLFFWDLADFALENLRQSTLPRRKAFGDGFLFFPVREPWLQDLNGDGDYFDEVTYLARPAAR